MLAAWADARRDEEQLVVAGIDDARRIPGVRFTGRLPRPEYRALVRRARVFLAAPRREDYGIAQLEALADGCMLVSTPAPGAYPARELARQLDPRLVSDDLVTRRCASPSMTPQRVTPNERGSCWRRSRAAPSTARSPRACCPCCCHLRGR